MKRAAYILAVVAWVSGISTARGPWSTAAAFLFPPYAWVLVADRIWPEVKP